MVPLDFLVWSFGLFCFWPFLDVPSASLAEPDLDDAGMLIWSESGAGLVHAGELSVTGSGKEERGSSLRSDSCDGAISICECADRVFARLRGCEPECLNLSFES